MGTSCIRRGFISLSQCYFFLERTVISVEQSPQGYGRISPLMDVFQNVVDQGNSLGLGKWCWCGVWGLKDVIYLDQFNLGSKIQEYVQ